MQYQLQKRQTFKSFPTLSILSKVEADVQIIPHSLDSLRSGLKHLLILSNDTDVLVIATYFVECFKSNGLTEL